VAPSSFAAALRCRFFGGASASASPLAFSGAESGAFLLLLVFGPVDGAGVATGVISSVVGNEDCAVSWMF
jgi:hypothetical protein